MLLEALVLFDKFVVALVSHFYCVLLFFDSRVISTSIFSMPSRRVFDLVPPCIETYLNNEMC
jgi:hypothetical protein